jgi:hypothetical protein
VFRYDSVREGGVAALLNSEGDVTELPADKIVRRTHVANGFLSLIGGRSAVVMEVALPGDGPLARVGAPRVRRSWQEHGRGWGRLPPTAPTPAGPTRGAIMRAGRDESCSWTPTLDFWTRTLDEGRARS